MASIAMLVILAVFAISMLTAFAMDRQSPSSVSRNRYDGGFGSGGDAKRSARAAR